MHISRARARSDLPELRDFAKTLLLHGAITLVRARFVEMIINITGRTYYYGDRVVAAQRFNNTVSSRLNLISVGKPTSDTLSHTCSTYVHARSATSDY